MKIYKITEQRDREIDMSEESYMDLGCCDETMKIKQDECKTCGNYDYGFCTYKGCAWIPVKTTEQKQKGGREADEEA